MTCPNHASFYLLTVARRGSCGPKTEKEVDLAPVTGLVLQAKDAEKFPQALGLKILDPFLSRQGVSMYYTKL